MSLIPMVIDNGSRGERAYDIYSRLLKDRIIFIGDEIDDNMATSVIAQLIYLQLEDPRDEISLYIMSPGGSVYSTLAIYDAMQNMTCPVSTYCMGMAASGAAVLLCGGAAGRRYALPSSRIMIHQPIGSTYGQETDIQIQATEMSKLKKMIYERMAKHAGKSVSQIEKDCERDNYMSAEEAIKYGIIDSILYPIDKNPRKAKNAAKKG